MIAGISVPTYLIIENRGAGATLIALVCIVMLIAILFRNIAELKLAQLYIRMSDTVQKAEVTIEQVRRGMSAIIEPLLNEAATSEFPFYEGGSFDQKYVYYRELVAVLREIGATDAEIAQTTRTWRELARHKLVTLIYYELATELGLSIDNGKRDERIKITIRENMTANQIHTSIVTAGLNLGSAATEWLAELEHFERTGEIRHPDRVPPMSLLTYDE